MQFCPPWAADRPEPGHETVRGRHLTTWRQALGTSADSIRRAEDRQGFKDTMESINQPCVVSM